jgi:Uma2 family endonuclease
MEMLSDQARAIAEVVGNRIRPLKRVEYDRLAAEGFFENEKVELLFGMVVEMAPIDPEHSESVYVVGRFLERQLGERGRVRIQSSFAASDDSEPEPDVFVVPNQNYWHEHPNHAFLIVEVSRSSLKRDRVKRLLYANGTVDEYWIVNHEDDCVEIFQEARDGAWTKTSTARRGDVIAPLRFADVKVPVDEILPPRRA